MYEDDGLDAMYEDRFASDDSGREMEEAHDERFRWLDMGLNDDDEDEDEIGGEEEALLEDIERDEQSFNNNEDGFEDIHFDWHGY